MTADRVAVEKIKRLANATQSKNDFEVVQRACICAVQVSMDGLEVPFRFTNLEMRHVEKIERRLFAKDGHSSTRF
ncbi:MAG: hypothetical protein ACJ74H_15970 [Thermoanaerobaculia bacterium]